MAPPRRRTRELKEPKEEKPTGRIEEEDEIEPEVFQFTFSEEGLTAKQCAEKMESLTTKEEFLQTIPQDDQLRFVTKALVGRKNQPLKCFNCDRVYASCSGFMSHLRKCELSDGTEEGLKVDAASYRTNPYLWLAVEKKNQREVLEQIMEGNYTCFSPGCTTKCSSSSALIIHLAKCMKPIYFSFKDRPQEFRQLDKKTKSLHIREALNWRGGNLECFLCGRDYSHQYGLQYHIDRCQLEKSEQPWKCYRCGHEAKVAQSETHLKECAAAQEKKLFEQKFSDSLSLSSEQQNDEVGPSKRRRTVPGGAPRVTARKNGTMLCRFRKSTVHRESNGLVTLADQLDYENECSSIYENWLANSANIAICDRLAHIGKVQWETTSLEASNPLHSIFTRQSVTILTEKVKGLKETVPAGARISTTESKIIEAGDSKATVAFCGAPINAIKTAPGKMKNGDDVICVCTFANETTLESDSSIVQFWKHRFNSTTESSELELWFLLHLPNRGTIMSMTWLQKNSSTDENLVGYAAFSTTLGEVLIYRIDSTRVLLNGNDVQVAVAEPDLTLKLPQQQENQDNESGLIATVKQEVDGEEVLPIRIDESRVPILKITWCGQDGGKTLVGLTAMGVIAVWNLDEDLEQPRCNIEDEWNSPPSDVAFLDGEHVAVGFREKMVKVINVYDWMVKLEESTMKTAGTRVHTDPRIVDSFFTFQSEYTTFPYPNAHSVSYIKMMEEAGMIVLIPTANTHQLMVWDAAMCPPSGTLVSCGIDGRLVASASSRFLNKGAFFANRNVMMLKRRKVMTEVKSMSEMLKEVKTEGAEPSTSDASKKEKAPLEESLVAHDDVCSKMWLEVSFDQNFEPGRPELSCRDQRIESLNCVDTNANRNHPVSFTGGEAGLLFAVPCKLIIEELDL